MRHLRLWMLPVAALVLLMSAGLLLPVIVARTYAPSARERAIELLDERFDDVRLDELVVEVAPGWSLLPRMSAHGSGLSISLPDHPGAPPFITINEFTARLGLFGLLRDPVRIDSLDIDQLRIQIPPDNDDKDERGPEHEPPPAFAIAELVADGTVLRILRADPHDDPLEFILHELAVDSAGIGEPMHFDAVLENALPPGRIETVGNFGPLRISDAGASPVSGEYTFEDADLSVFGGIAGMLYSEGSFDGVLERIEVKGFTETPRFQLESAGNPTSLRTDFSAIVDGTDGNTFLIPVDALLGGSRFRTEGGVSTRPGDDGKTVCVDAEGLGTRIEDFLRLAMKDEEPFMTGDLRFRSMVLLPPGESDVVDRLRLDGEFVIESALFPGSEVQDKAEKLSRAGRGRPAADSGDGDADGDESGQGAGADGDRAAGDRGDGAISVLRDERVFSDMRGGFKLTDGTMTLTGLTFTVPGARVSLEGSYDLVDRQLDFHGELRLAAKLSQTTHGVKSLLLKLIDPLFEHDDAGAVVPIKIVGTPDDPSFGIELGRVLTRKVITEPAPSDEMDGWRRSIPSCVELLQLPPPPLSPGAGSGT